MENKPTPNKRVMRDAGILMLNTVLFFGLYKALLIYAERTDETFYSFLVMLAYMLILGSFLIAYFIYNRCLYRKNLTPEDRPDTMTAQEKRDFLADGEARLAKSRWMMLIILPLVLTFLFDAVDIFILDLFR